MIIDDWRLEYPKRGVYAPSDYFRTRWKGLLRRTYNEHKEDQAKYPSVVARQIRLCLSYRVQRRGCARNVGSRGRGGLAAGAGTRRIIVADEQVRRCTEISFGSSQCRTKFTAAADATTSGRYVRPQRSPITIFP